MAREKTNKSEAIRAALTELGSDARNRDIIAHLADKKIKVSAQMVSTVRARAEGAMSVARVGRPGRKAASNGLSISALLTAKKLVNEAGSIEAAKQTLQTLAELI